MLFLDAIRWIADPANWASVNFGPGIGEELLDHIWLTFLSILFTAIIALPIGLYIGHTGKGRRGAILLANVVRGFPTLGVLSLLTLVFGLGVAPNVFVFVLLAVPSLLAGTYAGLFAVDRRTIDAARSIGFTEWQVLVRVEVPLAAPLIIGGLRSATLQVVASVTLVSNFGTNSLGDFILGGLASNDAVEIVAGSLLVTVLALVIDGLLSAIQRSARPRGVSRGRNGIITTARRSGSTRMARTPVSEGN
jgi:osmoprotectant transport system permease protein